MKLIERWRGSSKPRKYLPDLEAELTTAAANHYDADRNCRAMSAGLGWSAIVFSAIVASAILRDRFTPIFYGVLSIMAAIIGTAAKLKDPELQERAKRHLKAASDYLGIRDQVSRLVADFPDLPALDARLDSIVGQKKAITDAAPSLPYIVFYVHPVVRMILNFLGVLLVAALLGRVILSIVGILPIPDLIAKPGP